MSAAEAEELTRLVDAARKQVDARQQARARGLVAAARGPLPERAGACPVAIELPDVRRAPTGGFDVDRAERQMHALERVDLKPYRPDEVGTVVGPLAASFRGEAAGLSRYPFAEAKARLDEITSAEYWDYDVVIIEDERADAEQVDDRSFAAGHLRGRALLWSYAQNKVLCAAAFDAASSDTVAVREVVGPGGSRSNNATAALGADLLQNTIRDAVQNLSLVVDARAVQSSYGAGPM